MDGFGMMGGGFGGGAYGSPLIAARARDPRYHYANILAQGGVDTSPTTVGGGIGRLGQALVSALIMNKANTDWGNRDAAYSQTVANALKNSQGTPAETREYANVGGEHNDGQPTTINWNAVAPDQNRAIATLASNVDTAPMAMQWQQNENQFNRQRAATKEDQQTAQGFQREMALTQHNYSVSSMELQQAFAAAQQDKSLAAQERLQRATQAHSSAEAALQRTFALTSAGPIAGDRQRAENAANLEPTTVQTPTGPQVVPAGAAVAIAKEGFGGKMTDEQAKAAGFADRMVVSHGLIGKFGDAGTSPAQQAMSNVPGVGNYLVSKDYQQLDQASRDFINADLRRESGAAISPSEFDNAKKQYLPQPGDSAEVLRQKAANRAVVVQGMVRSAGNNYRPSGSQPQGQPAGGGIPPLPPGFTALP